MGAIFDDELKYDYFNSLGFLINSVPQCMKEPYKSKINSKIHTLYYIPSNASMDILKEVMEDVKDFTAGAPFEDDITILVIKRNKKESEKKDK